MASNIREFQYDPDNGLVFHQWFRKSEDLFLKDGVTVHVKYVNFVLHKHHKQKLMELIGVRVSLFSKWYQCIQVSKNKSDYFLIYAGSSISTARALNSTRSRTVQEPTSAPDTCPCTLEALITDCHRLQNLKHSTVFAVKQDKLSPVPAPTQTSQRNHSAGYCICVPKKHTNLNSLYAVN